MEKKNLWNDAAKYGAILALVSIAFTVAQMYLQNGVLSFASLLIYVLLLYYFTKRRATLYGAGENGYGYGQCLKFICCMALFAGILEGGYSIVASNWLFKAQYDELLNKSLAMMSDMGVYQSAQMDEMTTMMRTMYRSPIFMLFSGVLGSVIKGLFYGLFVSAFTKRTPNIFSGNNEQA
ncbi:MAG: DUF4199 domain-containing protein [Alistipes sp.]